MEGRQQRMFCVWEFVTQISLQLEGIIQNERLEMVLICTVFGVLKLDLNKNMNHTLFNMCLLLDLSNYFYNAFKGGIIFSTLLLNHFEMFFSCCRYKQYQYRMGGNQLVTESQAHNWVQAGLDRHRLLS